MQLGEMDLETAAREARGNWRKFDSFAWHDRPEDSAEWAIVYTHNRDSDLLDQSNADAIDKALAPFTEGDTPMSGPNITGIGLAGGSTVTRFAFTATARLPKHFGHTTRWQRGLPITPSWTKKTIPGGNTRQR